SFIVFGNNIYGFLWSFAGPTGISLATSSWEGSCWQLKVMLFSTFYITTGRLDIRFSRIGQPNLSQLLLVMIHYHMSLHTGLFLLCALFAFNNEVILNNHRHI
ncbi:hypothetical protein PAEPH01_2919, partial [Pancytospora epiphaga]